MKSRHDRDGALVEPKFSSNAGDTRSEAQQAFYGSAPQGDDDLGAQYFKLTMKILAAHLSLCGARFPILRRAAFDDIADVDLFAREPHGGNHLIEQLACRPDERQALGVFVCSWPFPHEAQPAAARPPCEHRVCAARVELTSFARSDQLLELT